MRTGKMRTMSDNTWRYGVGAPSPSLGMVGDYYVDTDTGYWYRLIGGSWTLIVNLKGQDGEIGLQGPIGPQGVPGIPGVSGTTSLATIITPVTIANIEGVVIGATIPANTFEIGQTYEFHVKGDMKMLANQSFTSVCRLRIGPITLLGNIAAQVSVFSTKGIVTAPFVIEAQLKITSIGAGTAEGWLAMWTGVAANFADDISPAVVTPVAVNTTINNRIELTYVSGNVSCSTRFPIGRIT